MKELLKILLDEFGNTSYPKFYPDGYIGLCECVSTLEEADKISVSEETELLDFIYKHAPMGNLWEGYERVTLGDYERVTLGDRVCLTFYYRWKPYNKAWRIKWLKKQIEKFDKTK